MGRERRPPAWLADARQEEDTPAPVVRTTRSAKPDKLTTEHVFDTQQVCAEAQSLIVQWNYPAKTALKEAHAVHGEDWSAIAEHMFATGFLLTPREAEERVQLQLQSGEWDNMAVEWLMEF